MEFRNLENSSVEDVLKVFNRSFSDYMIPLQLTQEQLEAKLIADNTRMDLSVGVFDDDELVAFMLNGLDEMNGRLTVYNGGTGVIPEKRGNGLTKRMYDFLFPILKAHGVKDAVLEVISTNDPAIHTYEKVGYSIERNLICFSGTINDAEKPNVEIRKLQEYDWPLMTTFGEVEPTWQNSSNSLDRLKSKGMAYGAYVHDCLVGYIIFESNGVRIQQIAVDPKFRRQGIASQLMMTTSEKFGNERSMINVDDKAESLIQFFNQIGLKPIIGQLEMRMSLDH